MNQTLSLEQFENKSKMGEYRKLYNPTLFDTIIKEYPYLNPIEREFLYNKRIKIQ